MLAIDVSDVGFGYVGVGGRRSLVLQHANLRVASGEIVALVGPNGAGKSTLLELIRGNLIPTIGTIAIGGAVIAVGGRLKRRPRISLVQQRPEAGLAPSMTLYENYRLVGKKLGLNLRNSNEPQMRDACARVVRLVSQGMDAKLDEQVRFASVGEQQALAILFAMESQEELVLLDEPTAALDGVVAERVMRLVVQEARRRGTAMLFVSHRASEAVEFADRVCILRDGRVEKSVSMADKPTRESIMALMA